MAELYYLRLVAARTRTVLIPVVAWLFFLVGVFADPHNEVGKTWGLTALLTAGISAWVVAAVLFAEPSSQADMTTIALGSRRGGRRRLEGALAACTTLALTATFILYPLLLAQLTGRQVFERAVTDADVANAAIAHLVCGILGASIGLLFSPPRIRRPATGFALIALAVLVIVATSPASDVALGPLAVARELADEPHEVSRALLASAATVMTIATIGAIIAAWWARRLE